MIKQLKFNNIYNYDCMEIIKAMPPRTIDHCITDIPYNRCSVYEEEILRRKKISRNFTSAKFINSEADVCNFNLKEFIKHIERITKKSILIFADIAQIVIIRDYLDKKKWHGYRLIIWNKYNCFPHNYKINYVCDTEVAVYMWRDHSSFNTEEKVVNTIYKYPLYCDKEKIHPTQKQPLLINNIIKDITKENDTIIDPCCGSGEIINDAMLLNRFAIGIEKNKKFYNKSKLRIDNLKNYNLIIKSIPPDTIPQPIQLTT